VGLCFVVCSGSALVLPATTIAKEPIQHVRSQAEVKKALIAESINAPSSILRVVLVETF
jgi:hypothetical protein